jgi:hypothetical protein
MRPAVRIWIALIASLTWTTLLWPEPAEAIPAFARKYRVSCALCHQPFPRLNAFGEEPT